MTVKAMKTVGFEALLYDISYFGGLAAGFCTVWTCCRCNWVSYLVRFWTYWMTLHQLRADFSGRAV